MGGLNSRNGAGKSDHAQLLSRLMKRKENPIVHTYNNSFLGFAARLSEDEAKSIGIWPESPSFDDKFMGPIPRRWKGTCMPAGNITCNRKSIGARYYDDPDDPGYIVMARDEDGHGTHVASIAAGSPVLGASYYGQAKGTARGGSPGARIAAYRVVGPDGESWEAAVLKAFDDAIADGVDVLSISLGSFEEEKDFYLNNTNAIGAFHAVERGITVVGSAGNDGPSRGTVDKVAPWILTVAANSIDHGRTIGSNQSDVARASDCIPGSLDYGKVKDKIVLCENKNRHYRPTTKFKDLKSHGTIGMIVIDDIETHVPFSYGTSPIAAVTEEDGAGIRTYIDSTSNALATILPTKTVIPSNEPAPTIVFFSSRGPPMYGIENLIKPDVAAPGLGILAAWPSNDASVALPGKEPPLFNIISGTSMACPHVSGIAARVKSWHPTWSPSAIKSAIMTTATHRNNRHAPITTVDGSIATPYDIGSGEINLFDPLWPGLVYETKTTDYVQFLCNMGYDASMIKLISSTVSNNFSCPTNSSSHSISDMNYPSVAVSGLKSNETRTVKRTVTNVGEVYSTYTATVEAPAGLQVQVVPNKLQFTKKVKTRTFQVTFKFTTANSSGDLFGSFTWCNGKYKVRSPFVAGVS
ncbi:co(2)-response secreted protease [Phtheirospermum japonicum]|uniref:Co(2)-response secreted protease n=1 Tax=Phtheirospermum japonicum TaxID=374723 RepID=A0A830BX06_9LAMI|nr:co(2)-response secreted protease [Phtheirospermum japonicum]